MNHQCHWTEVENIFLPREATIVRSVQATPTETHFTLQDDRRAADGVRARPDRRALALRLRRDPDRLRQLADAQEHLRPGGALGRPRVRRGHQAGQGRVGLRARPAGARLRPHQAPRAGRAHRGGRHRPLPDAQSDPVHPGPSRRVQALRPLLRRARARACSCSRTISPSGGRPTTSSTTRPSTRAIRAGRATSASSRRCSPRSSSSPRHARGHLRTADLLPVRGPRARP